MCCQLKNCSRSVYFLTDLFLPNPSTFCSDRILLHAEGWNIVMSAPNDLIKPALINLAQAPGVARCRLTVGYAIQPGCKGRQLLLLLSASPQFPQEWYGDRCPDYPHRCSHTVSAPSQQERAPSLRNSHLKQTRQRKKIRNWKQNWEWLSGVNGQCEGCMSKIKGCLLLLLAMRAPPWREQRQKSWG